MRRFTLLGLFILFTLVACSSGEATGPSAPLDIILIAKDIAYDAPRVETVAGQPVRLTLDNQGLLEHDFSIIEIPLSGEVIEVEHAEGEAEHDMSQLAEEPAVHVAAVAGEQGTIEFTPAAPGEYVFYCTGAGHREAGMEGVLVVK